MKIGKSFTGSIHNMKDEDISGLIATLQILNLKRAISDCTLEKIPENIPGVRKILKLSPKKKNLMEDINKKAGEIKPSHTMHELELITRPMYCRTQNSTGEMNIWHRHSLSESLFGANYDPEKIGIGVLGFAPAGLGRTTGACYISAELFNSGIPVRNMYMGRLPNINPENSGLRIDNPPKGFSL